MWKQMREDDFYQIAMKIVIVGNGVVGKSSMIQRYCNNIFTNEYKKTIGVDFLERFVQVGTQEIRLMLWDTAGQEEFDALTKAYYRGAQGCVVAFSTTDKASFEAVEKWKKKVEFECGHIPMALVQNKSDLLGERSVSTDEVDRLAQRLQMRLFLTSAKNNVKVDDVFYYLAKTYLESLEDEDEYEEPFALIRKNCSKPAFGSSLVPSNPLFGGGGYGSSPKKYLKKSKKALKQHLPTKDQKTLHVLPSGPPGLGPGSASSSLSAPLLQHYRYKSRFQLIPMRQANQPTILLHHPCQGPHYGGHIGMPNALVGRRGHRHHHKHRHGSSSNSFFSNNCWPL